MSQPQIDVRALWAYVTEQVKKEITLPSLWRSLEAARPVTLENEELVVGYPLQAADLQGLLMDARNRNSLEQIIERATRRRIRLRVIQGDTLEDWEAEKARDAESIRLMNQRRQQTTRAAAAAGTWDAVGEALIRKLTALPNRTLSSVQGRFLEQALTELVDAYDRLMPESPAEMDERSYSRALERFSERCGVPAAMLAYMVEQRRRSR